MDSMLRDLHNHTLASDGALEPAALLDMALEKGVDEIAITDHDSVDGLMQIHANKAQWSLNIIDGVELSANWAKQTVHVVGLNIDPTHSGLTSFIKEQKFKRQHRALQMAHKLEESGLIGTVADIEYMADQQNMVCRTHLAQYLLERGAVNSFANAFKEYLAKGAKAFIPDEWFALQDAVAIIRRAGGIAVLAHPTRYKMGSNKLQQLVIDFKKAGGQALEVCYPNINPGQKNLLANWANKHNLLGSQGSDFHALDKPWAQLGKFPTMPQEVTPVWSLWN